MGPSTYVCSCQQAFVARAAAHLDSNFRKVADAVLRQMASAPVSATPRLDGCSHPLRTWCNIHAPLLQVMEALQPGSLHNLQLVYCQTMNSILRSRMCILA